MRIEEAFDSPWLQALTPKRRAFVVAMMRNPLGTHTDWAREAGYKDCDNGGISVRAHEAYHDPKVQAAVMAITKAQLGAEGPLIALHAVLAMARDASHPQHAKAVEMILNRTGFNEKQQIEVVHRDLTGDALLERIRMLAEKHGVALDALPAPKVIEHEAEK